MAKRDDLPDPSPAGGEFIWPRPIPGLRAMTKQEIDRLAQAIGKPIKRDYLVHWVSTSISNTVTWSISPKRCRNGLLRLTRQGQKWLDEIDECSGKGLLDESDVTAVKTAVVQFCERAEEEASRYGRFVKPGTRTPPGLTAFLDNMIGIAKRANVLPSTPQRYMQTESPPPSFIVFVEQALEIAKDVIASSPIPAHQKRPALTSLHYSSRDALIRIIERVRGRIGSYDKSDYGLIEVDKGPAKRGARRHRRED